MDEREIINNSRALQERFPDTYREFFSLCPLVVSAPRGFWWSGEYSELFGGVAITQKIPLRVYVGIEAIRQNTVEIGSYRSYSMRRQEFTERRLAPAKERRCIAFLSKTLPALLQAERFEGCRIHILSELSFEHGLFSIGSFTAALSTALYLYYGLLEPATLDAWVTRPTPELRNDPATRFAAIHRLAWKLETVLDTERSSGSRSFSALVAGAVPLVYCTERRSGDMSHHPHGRVPAKITTNQELVDTIVWWGFRLDELTNGTVPDPWPVDAGLLFSGEEKSTDAVIRSLQATKDQFDVVEASLLDAFDRFIPKGSSVEPFFLQPIDPDHRLELWHSYLSGYTAISLEVLNALKDLIRRGTSRETIETLAQRLLAYQGLFRVLNLITPRIERLTTVLHDLVEKKDIEPFGLKCTGSGGGGDLLFISAYGHFSEVADELLLALRERIGNTVSLDYASWRDGIEEAGVRIEQMMSADRLSSFVSDGYIVLRQWGNGVTGGLKLMSHEQFAKESSRYDVLLDLPEERVSIRGKALTSREIHSSVATIDVLMRLLKAPGPELPATAFGTSSYVDRNEMQSKIITPLTKAFAKHTGKRLPLELQGGLRKDFRVRFRAGRLSVGVVEQRL